MRLGAILDSENPQKRVQIEPKLEEGPSIQEGQWSADWHRLEARLENPLIKIKPIYFEFLGITMQSNSYLILFNLFFKHPSSINSGKT